MGAATDFGNTAKGLTYGIPGVGWMLGSALRTIGGIQTAQRLPGEMIDRASKDQADNAAALRQQLLQKPKQVSPDNFLAMKSRQLANLRLGLASTITGAGGVPSATLSSPSLAASGAGKTKLGQ